MRFLLLMILGISLQIFPQNSYGTWEWTGDLHDSLIYTKAVVLASGEVLIAGEDFVDMNGVNRCERYDPVGKLWRQTGSTNANSAIYSMILLPNGKVFAITSESNVDCELYDPVAGEWTITSEFPSEIVLSDPATTQLQNGNILISGGFFNNWDFSDSCYIFDYQTENWSFAGTMNAPRVGHKAILLDDGRVFIAGGSLNSINYGISASCELYDPVNGTYAYTDSMLYPRAAHSLLKLSDGRVLILGGMVSNVVNYGNLVEIFDPATGQIDSLGYMTISMFDRVFCCQLLDGRVFIADCKDNFDSTPFRWEIFDLSTGSTIFWDYGLDNSYRFEDFIVLPEYGHQVLSLGSIHFPWEIGFPTKKVALFKPEFVPVEMAVFTADVLDGDVVLNWTTATETNNSGFYVERDCKDDPGWKELGYVEGNGTTTELCSYTFTDTPPAAGTYYYRLRQVDFDGTTEYSTYVEATVTTPTEFALHQNYPNPFNPATLISYSLPEAAEVRLTVFNQTGEQIAMLYNGMQEAGLHEAEWNGMEYPSGVYYVRLEAGQFTQSIKMMLLK
jgi:hypothetical protein